MKALNNILCRLLLVLVFKVGAVISTSGQGTVLAQHLGSSDPTTEGFSLSVSSDGSVGPVSNDHGFDAWQTHNNGGGFAYYVQALSPQQQAQVAGSDWVMSASLRIVSPSSLGVADALTTGSELFQLFFGSTPNGDPFVQIDSPGNPKFVLTGAGSTYNTYQLKYDSMSGTAGLWVDGVEEANNIPGIPNIQTAEAFWGLGQSAGPTANWSQFSLTAVPEPSTTCLLLFGGGAMALRLRARRPSHHWAKGIQESVKGSR